MIDEVKKIITERYKEEYEKAKKEYYSKEIIIASLEMNLHTLEQETAYPVMNKHFNFIQRVLTKRGEYREHKEKERQYMEKSRKADEIRTRLSTEKPRLEREIAELQLEEKMDSTKERLEKAQNAKVIRDLGITLPEAIQILEEHQIPVVLTEEDKVITEVERNYSSKSALIGVHKTKFAPSGSRIQTAKAAKAALKVTMIINGQECEYEYTSARDTVHISINDEVSSHAYGSWEDCSYAILIPMEDIPNDQIGYASSVDTFTKGSLSLSPRSWILCPLEEVEQLKRNNPSVNVIGYEGKSVLGYSAPFLSALGYRAEEVSMWAWRDDESTKQFKELMNREGVPQGAHSYTYFHEDERVLTYINMIVAACNMLKDKGFLNNTEDIPSIYKQLMQQNGSFVIPVSSLCSRSLYDSEKYPEAIKGNHRHLDVFFSKMEESGFYIPDVYKTVIRNIDKIGLGYINENNCEDIFSGIGEVSEEEKTFLDELHTSIYQMTIERGYEEPIKKFITSAVLDSASRSKGRILNSELDAEQNNDIDI